MNHNRQHQAFLFLALATLHLGAGRSWALDRQASASQYSQQQWSAEDGFRIGQVSSIAQTPDGYLWVGGENGLLSFDGEKFHSFPTSGPSSITHVLGLTTDGHGALWIWMQGANVLRYSSGKFINVTDELGLPDGEITVLSSGSQGSLLLSTLGQQIFEYKDGRVREIGSTRIPNTLILALAKSQDGRVWAGIRDYGLSYVEGGRVVMPSETGTFGFDDVSLTDPFLSGSDKAIFNNPKHPFMVKLKSQLKKASALKKEEYGVFFASAGHAALYDYPTAKGLQKVASDIWDRGGVIGRSVTGRRSCRV